MTVKGYDLVGDIHGYANALHRLLIKLGYAEDQGIFRLPSGKVAHLCRRGEPNKRLETL